MRSAPRLATPVPSSRGDGCARPAATTRNARARRGGSTCQKPGDGAHADADTVVPLISCEKGNVGMNNLEGGEALALSCGLGIGGAAKSGPAPDNMDATSWRVPTSNVESVARSEQAGQPRQVRRRNAYVIDRLRVIIGIGVDRPVHGSALGTAAVALPA